METSSSIELNNAAFQLSVSLGADGQVQVTLLDAAGGTVWAEGGYVYRAARAVPEGDLHASGLQGARGRVDGDPAQALAMILGL